MSVQEKFLAAVDIINNLPSDGTFQPSEDLMLKLYAYYMQATEGSCKISKPSIWYYSLRAKWNAWNDLGNMEKEVAMEKYVEELTKVIETMSYNENVSRFMSLIGPFYEVVPTDEIESEKKIDNKNCTEYAYPVKNLEDLQTIKNEPSHVISLVQSNPCINEDFNFSSSDCLCTKFSNHKCDHSSGKLEFYSYGSRTSPRVRQKNISDIFKSKSVVKNQSFVSQQDILILTFINLQNSMEEIVKKFDELQTLAKSADLNYEKENKGICRTEWNLGVSGIAFALIWPIAVHLCARAF